MTTFETVCTIIGVVSVLGLLFTIWLSANNYQETSIFGFVSFFGLIFALIGVSASGSTTKTADFDMKRDLVLNILSTQFDIVCDRTGVNARSTTRPNCFEKDGFRVWREGEKVYLATIIGNSSVVDMIVNEDELLAKYRQSIIYWSDKIDERRLSYTFGHATSFSSNN